MALIPFEKNDSTKYISPTKTPEYLAAGKPVISSSIVDVVTPYADNGLVYIADNAKEFIAAAEMEIDKTVDDYQRWLTDVDNFLADVSWDSTTDRMMEHIESALRNSGAKKEVLRSVA
jgi:UDP-galactopyranose mutase